jgi:hypothetical protein
MKLSKRLVKEFEKQQKEFGTEAAVYNVYWNIAAEIFKAAGITRIKTTLKHLKA